jgi:hypothetical protein
MTSEIKEINVFELEEIPHDPHLLTMNNIVRMSFLVELWLINFGSMYNIPNILSLTVVFYETKEETEIIRKLDPELKMRLLDLKLKFYLMKEQKQQVIIFEKRMPTGPDLLGDYDISTLPYIFYLTKETFPADCSKFPLLYLIETNKFVKKLFDKTEKIMIRDLNDDEKALDPEKKKLIEDMIIYFTNYLELLKTEEE